MLSITANPTNATVYINRLLMLKSALSNRRQLHQRIKDEQIEQWAINFDEEGALYVPWPPQAKSTIEARGPSHILVRRGILLRSFHQQNRAGKVSQTGILWEFENQPPAYPAYHQRGGYIRNRQGVVSIVPSRILWTTNRHDAERVVRITDEWIDEVIKRYFP